MKGRVFMISTPHIVPTAEIAETILLPGDPLRAKYIAENFFDDMKQFNAVRGALGFTGSYKGKQVSVMGTGMGIPSMGIYSYELINMYGCKNLIRIGSCGGLQENVNVYDIVFAMGVCTNSNYASQYGLSGSFSPIADFGLLSKAKSAADEMGIVNHIGNVLTSDIFYWDNSETSTKWKKMGVLAVEMETAALYTNSARYGAKALALYTVSDHLIKNQSVGAEERQNSFTNMMNVALSII